MFKLWHIVLLAVSLGVAGCTEMDTGSQDLDAITQPPQQSNEPQSVDSAYDDAKKELSEAADVLDDLSTEPKEKFVQEIDEQLKDLDTSIVKMKEQAKEVKEDDRKEIEQQLAEIEKKRQALLDRLEELGESSGNAWEDFREGVINAWDELKNARDDASSGIEVKVGNGVDVKVGDGVKIEVGQDGADVDVSLPNAKSDDK